MTENDGDAEMVYTQVSKLDKAQERSLIDELRSIVVRPADESIPVPPWLLAFRVVAIGWAALAGFCTILFGLFRL